MEVSNGIVVDNAQAQLSDNEMYLCDDERNAARQAQLSKNWSELRNIASDVGKEMIRLGYENGKEIVGQVQEGASQAYDFVRGVAQEYPAEFQKMYGEPLKQVQGAITDGAIYVTDRVIKFFKGE